MSDVLPSIIVLAITTLLVFGREHHPSGQKGAPRAGTARPAQRAELQGEIAKAPRHAGHSREASTAFSEACTAYLRIMSRIGANAFEHFRRAALRSAQFIAMPARYEFADPLTLYFRSSGRSGAAAMAFAGALR
jgi:hypothetical protein